MKKKLVLFCFSLLVLGGLVALPGPVAAGCPPTCPIPGYPNITAYCNAECGCPYANTCGLCFNGCYNGSISGCESICKQCGLCCDPY